GKGKAFFHSLDAVALIAEMREANLFPSGSFDAGKELAGGGVRQMPVTAGDALLEGPRALAFLQEARAVIALHHKQIDIPDLLPHKFGSVTEVRHPGDSSQGRKQILAANGKNKPDRIVRVVRDRKALHG